MPRGVAHVLLLGLALLVPCHEAAAPYIRHAGSSSELHAALANTSVGQVVLTASVGLRTEDWAPRRPVLALARHVHISGAAAAASAPEFTLDLAGLSGILALEAGAKLSLSNLTLRAPCTAAGQLADLTALHPSSNGLLEWDNVVLQLDASTSLSAMAEALGSAQAAAWPAHDGVAAGGQRWRLLPSGGASMCGMLESRLPHHHDAVSGRKVHAASRTGTAMWGLGAGVCVPT